MIIFILISQTLAFYLPHWARNIKHCQECWEMSSNGRCIPKNFRLNCGKTFLAIDRLCNWLISNINSLLSIRL